MFRSLFAAFCCLLFVAACGGPQDQPETLELNQRTGPERLPQGFSYLNIIQDSVDRYPTSPRDTMDLSYPTIERLQKDSLRQVRMEGMPLNGYDY